MNACEVDGCTKPSRRKKDGGLCRMHDQRKRRHGSTDDPKCLTLEERFLTYVIKAPSGCWIFRQLGTGGYGYFSMHSSGDGRWRPRRAHRVAHELFIGPIPPGREVDHLCRVRRCVNPMHLAAVPGRVNNQRSSSPSARNARLTACRRGHPLSGENLQIIRSAEGVKRRCKTCARARKKLRAVAGGEG